VLAPAVLRNDVEMILFTETTTIGIRRTSVERTVLDRREETAATPWGPVRVKISSFNGTACSVTPELDDCRRLAAENRVPLKTVLKAAGQTR
jgi:hypothetical protein